MPLLRHNWRITLLGLCLVTSVSYVLSYAVDSLLGGYYLKPEMDGIVRYDFGLAVPAAIMWQPRWGHDAVGRSDLLGKVYHPMIWLDRRLVHKTKYLFEDEGALNSWLREAPLSEFHPEFRRELGEARRMGRLDSHSTSKH